MVLCKLTPPRRRMHKGTGFPLHVSDYSDLSNKALGGMSLPEKDILRVIV